jgi:hypothetical protein
MPLALPVGFSTFIPPLFPVTLTHALFDKILVERSLVQTLYLPSLTSYGVSLLPASVHSPGGVTPMSQTLLHCQQEFIAPAEISSYPPLLCSHLI